MDLYIYWILGPWGPLPFRPAGANRPSSRPSALARRGVRPSLGLGDLKFIKVTFLINLYTLKQINNLFE